MLGFVAVGAVAVAVAVACVSADAGVVAVIVGADTVLQWGCSQPPPPPLPKYLYSSSWPRLALMLLNIILRSIYVGVGVGWQQRCKTCQSLRELYNQGTFFFFFLALTRTVIE